MRYCKTRQAALARGSKYYKTGEPCKRGHISHRFTSTKRCVECDRDNARERHRLIKKRTPAWANLDAIKSVYDRSVEMGEEYVVDHIIPLKHELVSGLHVDYNLQVITGLDNAKKQNRFIF